MFYQYSIYFEESQKVFSKRIAKLGDCFDIKQKKIFFSIFAIVKFKIKKFDFFLYS